MSLTHHARHGGGALCWWAEAYLEEGTVQQLLASSDDGVLVLVLPLQSLREPLHQGGQRAARETLAGETVN